MRLPLATATATAIALACPAQAQWGSGDGAQAGATAYCAARAAGKDDSQASRAASNAMVNGMSGSFTSNMATIITGGRVMRDSLRYLIQKQCPEFLISESPADNAETRLVGSDVGKSIDQIKDKNISSYSTPGVIGIAFSCLSAGKESKIN